MQTSTPWRNVNDDDDDSHTTLSRGGTYEKDEVESITSSVDLLASPSTTHRNGAAPSPSASLQSITSPSTQTLNILSQHDAIGGGNLRYDRNNMDRDASAVTRAQSQMSASTNARARPTFSPTKSPNKSVVPKPTMHTRVPKTVTRARPVQMAGAPSTTITNAYMNAQDQQAAVVLAHKLAATILPQEPPPRRHEKQVTAVAAAAAARVVNQDKPPLSSSEDIVPFCKACQKSESTNRVHHALCPKHPQFDNSGAMEKLDLIRRGMEMKCEACKLHYQHGRVVNPNLAHVDKCPRRTQPLRQAGLVLTDEAAHPASVTVQKSTLSTTNIKKGAPKKNTFSATSTPEKALISKTTSKTGKATGKKKSDANKKQGTGAAEAKKSSSRNSLSEEGRESQFIANAGTELIGGSQETSGSGSTAAIPVGRRPLKKRHYEYESDNEDDMTTTGKENSLPISRRAPLPKRTKFTKKGSNVPLVVEAAPAKQTGMPAPAPKKRAPKKNPLQNNAIHKSNANSLLKPNWVPCENPWGPSGYQEGDVVLVDTSGGFTHHETIYGGERFTVSPFGLDYDYGNSHRTPSEGFDVILLTRDPNAQHPWGFTYRRHEFGGACLVSSVDPWSPAASAVYRGNESDTSGAASLRIHDMILSMNGKSLGGMTELGVAVELDVCGREMELVVARYRDSAGAAQQLIALERCEWKTFDDAMNDKRRLDWFEMNGNSGARSLPTIDMLQNNDLMQFDVHRGNGAVGSSRYSSSPLPDQICFQNRHPSPGSQRFSHSQLSLGSQRSLVSRKSGRSQTSRSEASGTWAEDDDAWLGCVCGEIHPEPVRVFWIQCDECKSWYNVAPVCVGFSEFEASSIGNFFCRGCEDSVVVEQASVRSNRSTSQASFQRENFGKRLSAVPRSSPPSITAIDAPVSSKNRSSLSATEILDDRNQRRTEDGCFLPLRTPKKKADGTYARPCGRAPPGMVWDHLAGVYAPMDKVKGSSQSTSPATSTPESTKNADDFRIRHEDKITCEIATQPPNVPPKHVVMTTNGRLEPTTDTTGLQKSESSEQSKSQPTVTKVDQNSSEILAEMPTVSPPADVTNGGPPSTSKNTKRGSRLEREMARERRMTEDGCLLPNSSLTLKDDGTYARPRGRGPAGWFWDGHRGVYAPPNRQAKSKSTPSPDSHEDEKFVASMPTLNSLPKQPSTVIPAIIGPDREVSVTITGMGAPTKPKLLPVGTPVNVAERVSISCNKAGGAGTIINYNFSSEDGTATIFYDVKYSLGGKETGIEDRWVRATGDNM